MAAKQLFWSCRQGAVDIVCDRILGCGHGPKSREDRLTGPAVPPDIVSARHDGPGAPQVSSESEDRTERLRPALRDLESHLQ